MKKILLLVGLLCFASSCTKQWNTRYTEGRYESGDFIIDEIWQVNKDMDVYVLKSNHTFTDSECKNKSLDRDANILYADHKDKYRTGDHLEIAPVNQLGLLLNEMLENNDIDSSIYEKYLTKGEEIKK